MRIGDALRSLRKKRRMTQKTLADESGYSKDYIWKVENHRERPSLKFLEAAAEVLGAEIEVRFRSDDLSLPFEGEAESPSTAEGVGLDSQGRARSCPKCGENRYGAEARYCPKCGWALYNFCVGAARHINRPDARWCEACGEPTWWSHEELDRDGIPHDVRSSRSIEVARETM